MASGNPPRGNGVPQADPRGPHRSLQQALADLQRVNSLRILQPVPPPMLLPRGYFPALVAPRPLAPFPLAPRFPLPTVSVVLRPVPLVPRQLAPRSPRPAVGISSLGEPTYRGHVPQITGAAPIPGPSGVQGVQGPTVNPGPSVPGPSSIPGPSALPPPLPLQGPSPRHAEVQREHRALQEELSRFCRQHTSPRAIVIATDYMQQVKCLERRRENALRNGQSDFMSQNSFDEQHLRLIRESRELMQRYRGNPDPDEKDGSDDQAPRKANGRFSDRATLILETWYAQHLTNPYITPQEADELGRKAGITGKEVSKWMDNRRNRDGNSKKNCRHHPYKKNGK